MLSRRGGISIPIKEEKDSETSYSTKRSERIQNDKVLCMS